MGETLQKWRIYEVKQSMCYLPWFSSEYLLFVGLWSRGDSNSLLCKSLPALHSSWRMQRGVCGRQTLGCQSSCSWICRSEMRWGTPRLCPLSSQLSIISTIRQFSLFLRWALRSVKRRKKKAISQSLCSSHTSEEKGDSTEGQFSPKNPVL